MLTQYYDHLFLQAFPNPFKHSVTIEFIVPENTPVILDIYSMLGRHLITLYNGTSEHETVHRAVFEPGTLSSGLYIAKLTAASHPIEYQKLYLVR